MAARGGVCSASHHSLFYKCYANILNILFYDLTYTCFFALIIVISDGLYSIENQVSLFNIANKPLVSILRAANTEKPGISVKCAYSAYMCIAQHLENQVSKFTVRRIYFNGQTSVQSEMRYVE